MTTTITTPDIEIAIAKYFDYRQNVIVPNVAWGLLRHREADMLVLRPSGYIEEVEIKRDLADIRRDLQKKKTHWDRLVRRCWFAIPETITDISDIPEMYGILTVSEKRHRYGRWVRSLRVAKLNPDADKATDAQRLKLLHLGCMRVWTLKDRLHVRESRRVHL